MLEKSKKRHEFPSFQSFFRFSKIFFKNILRHVEGKKAFCIYKMICLTLIKPFDVKEAYMLTLSNS